MYTVVNETYPYGRHVELPDRGVDSWGECDRRCRADITISPTDMRYNGALITGIVDHPDCFNSSNVTDSFTLNIQGRCIKVYSRAPLSCTVCILSRILIIILTLLQVPRKLYRAAVRGMLFI